MIHANKYGAELVCLIHIGLIYASGIRNLIMLKFCIRYTVSLAPNNIDEFKKVR
jgi:hypothetical protein